MKQIVRNPEVRSNPATSKSSESQEIPIQQQIRNLQEEVGALCIFRIYYHKKLYPYIIAYLISLFFLIF